MVSGRARVLVVEDELPVRSALEVALRQEGYYVRTEADGVSIDEAVRQFHPDVVVLDVHLPVGPNGYQIARQLRRASDLPMLFLTSADSVDARLAGFNAGGDDYLVKPFAMAELLARIRALLQRSGRISRAAREVGPLLIDEGARRVVHSGKDVVLTRIEYELLAALAKHPGHVLSKTQLLAAVWGYDAYDDYDDNVVEVHMSALRRKLEAHGPRLVHTVRRLGYVLRP